MSKLGFRLVLITALLSATDSVRSPANFSDEYLESCGLDQTIIHRKRRFLTFPPRSELLFRISLLKSTPWKTNVFTIHEIDVQIPLPENLHAILFEKGSTHHKSRMEENNGFLDYFTVILQLPHFSISGTILRMNERCSKFFECPVSFVPDFMMEEVS